MPIRSVAVAPASEEAMTVACNMVTTVQQVMDLRAQGLRVLAMPQCDQAVGYPLQQAIRYALLSAARLYETAQFLRLPTPPGYRIEYEVEG